MGHLVPSMSGSLEPAQGTLSRIRRLLVLAAELCGGLCEQKAAMPARLNTLRTALRNTEKSLGNVGRSKPSLEKLYELEMSLQGVLEILHRLACLGELLEVNEQLFRLLSVALVMDSKETFDEWTTQVFQSLTHLGLLRNLGVYYKKRLEDDSKDVEDVMNTLLRLETNDSLWMGNSLGAASEDLDELLQAIKSARRKLSQNVMSIPAAFVEQVSAQVIAFAHSASLCVGIPHPANLDLLERLRTPAPRPYKRATWMDQVSVMEFRYSPSLLSNGSDGDANGVRIRSELHYWLKRYNHGRHIMKMYDYFVAPSSAANVTTTLCVLVESCKTSLYNLLHKSDEWGEVDQITVDYISFGILHGLQFLHGNGFAHGSLNSQTIFLGGEARSVVKLGGFLGEPMCPSGKTQNYLAPEVLSGRVERSFQADSYAFGMVMYELIERSVPFADIKPDYLSDLVCNEALRPSFTDVSTVHAWVQSLLRSCWSNSPWQRPSVENIVHVLNMHNSLRPSSKGTTPTARAKASPDTHMSVPRTLGKLSSLQQQQGKRVSVRTSACIGSLLARLNREWKDEPAAGQLLSLLKNNCMHKPEEEVNQAFKEHRAIHALIEAIRIHPTNESIQADAYFLLGKSFAAGAGSKDEASEAVPLVVNNVAAFLESREVFGRAVFALKEMDVGSVSPTVDDVVPLLLEGTKEFVRDEELCRDSLSVFADCVARGDVPWRSIGELVDDASKEDASLRIAVLYALNRLATYSHRVAKELLHKRSLTNKILKMIEQSEALPQVQEAAMELLRQLASTRSSALMGQRVVLTRVLTAMLNFRDNASIQGNTCGAISHLAALSTGYEQLLVKSKALEMTKEALDTFPENVQVTEQALRALAQMAGTPSSGEQVSIAKLCIAAQQRFPKHRLVALAAMDALHELCQLSDGRVADVLLQEGYLRLLMETMSKNATSPSVQALCYACLQDLTLLHDVSCNLPIIAAGCVGQVTANIQRLRSFEAVAASGLACLAKLAIASSESSELQRQLREANTLACVLDLLREYRTKRRIVRQAVWALWAVLRYDVSSMKDLAEMEGVALLERCAKKFVEVDTVNVAVFTLLFAICDKFPGKKAGLARYRFNRIAIKVLQRKQVSDDAVAAVFRYFRGFVIEDVQLATALLKLSGNGDVLWRALIGSKAKPAVLEPGLYLLGSLCFSSKLFDADATVLLGVTTVLEEAISQHHKVDKIIMAAIYCIKRLLTLRSSNVDQTIIKSKIVRAMMKALKQHKHKHSEIMTRAALNIFHSDVNPAFVQVSLLSFLTLVKGVGDETSFAVLKRVLLGQEGNAFKLKQGEAIALREVAHTVASRVGGDRSSLVTAMELLALAWRNFEDSSEMDTTPETSLVSRNIEEEFNDKLVDSTLALVAAVGRDHERFADAVIENGVVKVIMRYAQKEGMAFVGNALCVLAASCSTDKKTEFMQEDVKAALVSYREACELEDEIKQGVDALIRSSRSWLDVIMRK